MSSFTSPLIVEDLGNRKFKLVEPFSFWFDWDEKEFKQKNPFIKDRLEIIVKPGLITDFASVPRIFWNILPPYGRYGKAAVLHDALYQFNTFKRYICDRLFLLAMEVLKVPKWKRYLMYYAVRMFGKSIYQKYAKKINSNQPPLDEYEKLVWLVEIKEKEV